MESIDLPLVLAGPIVRRAEAAAVWIWLCTSRRIDIEGSCFIRDADSATPSLRLCGAGKTARQLQLGKSCFVQLIQLTPFKGTFSPGAPVFYNLDTGAGNKSREGKSWAFEQEVPILSLCPPDHPYPLPSFLVPQLSNKEPTRILFSSCRRTSDRGDDPGAVVHELLSKILWEEATSGKSKRHHHNLLIGDQIYADDVDDWCFRYIRTLGIQLFGRAESVLSGPHSGVAWSAIGPSDRAAILSKNGLSSEKLDNHCVSLAEFLALYCVCFASEALDKKLEAQVKDLPAVRAQEAAAANDIVSWFAAKRHFRRLLAHIPTYCIADDHEVSDDWNLDCQWGNSSYKVRDQVLLPSALLAFFAFQGWGNDPENAQWEAQELDLLQSELDSYIKGESRELPHGPVAWHWHCLTPGKPAIAMLDTRTQRNHRETPSDVRSWVALARPNGAVLPSWTSVGKTGNTSMLDTAGLSKLKGMLKHARSGSTCIIVSPAVVVGASFLSRAVDVAVGLGPSSRQEAALKFDIEDWHAHPKSYENLFNLLKSENFTGVVFFSGDIHCGYVAEGAVGVNKSLISVFQAVSSGARNQYNSTAHQLGLKLMGESADTYEKVWMDNTTVSYAVAKSIAECNPSAPARAPDMTLEIRRSSVVFSNNWGEAELEQNGVRCRLLSKRSDLSKPFQCWNF